MAKPGFDPRRVTGVLTSCGRPDLLEETLASLAWHMAPPRLLITEDAADETVAALCVRRFPFAEVRLNRPKRGHLASVDCLYGAAHTDVVLHLEDDWRFDAPVDAAAALSFLDSAPQVSAVVLRAFDEVRGEARAKSDIVTHAGQRFAVMRPDAHDRWFGYTFNPCLARRTLWQTYGPFAPFKTEEGVSAAMKAAGFTVAFLLPGAARHIGGGRNVPDPVQGMKDRGSLSKAKGELRRLGRALNPFSYTRRKP
jgi:hypothetical protein